MISLVVCDDEKSARESCQPIGKTTRMAKLTGKNELTYISFMFQFLEVPQLSLYVLKIEDAM